MTPISESLLARALAAKEAMDAQILFEHQEPIGEYEEQDAEREAELEDIEL